MTDPARRSAEASAPLPDLILYSRDGCHLCDEARDLIAILLAERGDAGLTVPKVVERDIETNADWEREFLTTIPVVELGPRRLELATSAARLRRLLEETLDRAPAAS
ncbi:MAG: glutaredoxin family protein [Chloroflexota bacterium]